MACAAWVIGGIVAGFLAILAFCAFAKRYVAAQEKRYRRKWLDSPERQQHFEEWLEEVGRRK